MSESKQIALPKAQFDPQTVYSLDELDRMLGGMVTAKRFLERLHVPRRFRRAVLGSDIICALENPPDGSELGSPAVAPSAGIGAVESTRVRAGGRKAQGRDATAPLRAIQLEEVLHSDR